MENIVAQGYIRRGRHKIAGHYLEVDYALAQAFRAEHGQRIRLSFKQAGPYHRALQVRKDGCALVVLSKEVLKAAGAQENDLIQFEIQPDHSAYGMPFPEELKEVFSLDPEAQHCFTEMTKGGQRGLLHYVHSGKSTETRIKRSFEMAEKLKNNDFYSG